ncbi:YcgN family cysteine cluster protein, partial [Halochromatium glycolicum]
QMPSPTPHQAPGQPSHRTRSQSSPQTPEHRYWERVPLAQMSAVEWESLCDGCGKCCVTKFEDEDTGAIHYTDVACHLLDHQHCQCSDYLNRSERVPDCVTLTPETLADPRWMPQTCAYRLLAEGKPLPAWHPLVCGDPEAVHAAGESVRGRVECETVAGDPLMRLIEWIR